MSMAPGTSNVSPAILARIVSLVCQGLTQAPDDNEVWLDGLRILSDPKLHRSLGHTISIWMPLLKKSLDPARGAQVNRSGLLLLEQAADLVEPMKMAFVKPFKTLLAHQEQSGQAMEASDELVAAMSRLELDVPGVRGRMPAHGVGSMATSQPNTPRPPTNATPLDHPLLSQILAQNLPLKARSVHQAWTPTLLNTNAEINAAWLRNLYQATIEASAVPELVIASRLDVQVHVELFPIAFKMCYDQIRADTTFKTTVDHAIIRILGCDPNSAAAGAGRLLDVAPSREGADAMLELIAALDKLDLRMPEEVFSAAIASAMSEFGDMNQPLLSVKLWYAEQEAARTLKVERFSDLVEAYIRIGPSGYDAAWSTLQWVRDDYEVKPDPMWITQLAHWQRALDAQDEADSGHVGTFGSFNTRMVCYHALGQFDKGYALSQALYEGLNDYERRETSHWATAAAWHMGDYSAMADYLAFHPKGTSKSLYKAIIDVQSGQYAPAFQHISKAQTLAYDELQSKLVIGPQESLKLLAKTEYLVELQEVIQYKSQPEQRQSILTNWRARFKRSHADSNSWLRRLQIWGLACPPTTFELQVSYLDCAKLCESQGMHEAAQRIIRLVTPEVKPPGCKVEYTQLRFMWKDAFESGNQQDMSALLVSLFDHASTFVEHLDVKWDDMMREGLGMQPLDSVKHVSRDSRRSLARRIHRLGQWTEAMSGQAWLTDPASEVYRYYSLAAKLDATWFNGSHSLATAAMAIFEAHEYSRNDSVALNSYVVPAVRGLFQAVQAEHSPEKMLKALLRLVTIWFRYGESDSILSEVEHQLEKTDISSWLLAIPQLIARLGTKHRDLQGVLIGLLKNVASAYPHAIIWPIMTASQTSNDESKEAATVIMNHISTMRDGSTLVAQAETVAHELIRVSISWMEKWRNIIDKCLPRTELMEIAWHEVPLIWQADYEQLSHPDTPDEQAFVQRFGRPLEVVYKALLKYRNTRSVGYVNTAYTEVYKLFGDLDAAISQQYKGSNAKILVKNTAPRLLTMKDCILTVPGQYDPQVKLDDQAFIDSFPPVVDILSSKMLPRKLSITSWRAHRDDFTSYTFLLKGNEDLRGDERIMQLFNLINTLLNHSSDAFSRNLHLLPYEVIPLSPSAGLVSWVPNTQQLQAMVQANREKHRNTKLSDKELGSMLGYDPETFDFRHDNPRLDLTNEMDKYDQLPTEIKVKRLEAAWSHSDQSDLKNVLWQRSPSAEVWIRRRTNFARTLGVGSFVGHIIGLGDRHGSNILVDQLTWTALHIDFGDLFCIAQERAYLPEKVPFRLTRMMTNTFELASNKGKHCPGSRGSYKQASIVSMNVLRENRGSLLAMLEAFLYDPLLSWTSNSNPSAVTQPTGAQHSDKRQQQQSSSLINPAPARNVAQSVVPALPYQQGNSDAYKRIDNSLIGEVGQDSWIAKIAVGGMTNARALKVLAAIERKLAGYEKGSEVPLTVKEQVQVLIEDATDPKNLAQGYVLGWIPQW